MANYFSVPDTLAGPDRFAKRLSGLDMVELEILVVSHLFLKTSSTERKGELKYSMERLKAEKGKQLRIVRLSALIDENDSEIMKRVDFFWMAWRSSITVRTMKRKAEEIKGFLGSGWQHRIVTDIISFDKG